MSHFNGGKVCRNGGDSELEAHDGSGRKRHEGRPVATARVVLTGPPRSGHLLDALKKAGRSHGRLK